MLKVFSKEANLGSPLGIIEKLKDFFLVKKTQGFANLESAGKRQKPLKLFIDQIFQIAAMRLPLAPEESPWVPALRMISACLI